MDSKKKPRGLKEKVPLMLDFAGVPTPDYMQGASFRSILETGEEPAGWKQSAYYHYWQHLHAHDNPACIAIRSKRHKLILLYGTSMYGDTPDTPPAWELYDLKTDPGEDNNVIDNPEYAGVVEQLKKDLKARRAELKEHNPEIPFNKVIDEFWDNGSDELARAVELSHSFRVAKERGEYLTNGKPAKKKKSKK